MKCRENENINQEITIMFFNIIMFRCLYLNIRVMWYVTGRLQILGWTMQNFFAFMVLWIIKKLIGFLSNIIFVFNAPRCLCCTKLIFKENVLIIMVCLIEKIPWCGAIFTGFIFNLFQIINRLLMRNYDKFLPVASTYVKIK